MDPVTLFGIATAATVLGVSLLSGIKLLYTRIQARRNPTQTTPQVVFREPSTQTNVPAMSL